MFLKLTPPSPQASPWPVHHIRLLLRYAKLYVPAYPPGRGDEISMLRFITGVLW